MDVHNQRLVFPTVVVCPTKPFDPKRTHKLAFYLMWVPHAIIIFPFYLYFYILCCVCGMKYCFRGNQRTNDSAEETHPFFESLSRLSFDNLNSAVESNSIILDNDVYMKRLYKSPLRFLPFQVQSNENYIFWWQDKRTICL